MPPPRDRLGAMQAQAYFEGEDDYNIPMDDDMDPRMQEFFHNIETMRDTANQVQNDINKVKKLQNDILSSPMVDAKAKQELDDTMNAIKVSPVFFSFGSMYTYLEFNRNVPVRNFSSKSRRAIFGRLISPYLLVHLSKTLNFNNQL